MNPNADYFARYEAIAAISGRMLMAARRSLWNDLVHLQEEYRHEVDLLKEAELDVALDESERSRKYDLVCRILADDAAIRDLANPRLANLSALFAGRPARVIKELYGAR
ncbi:flagellar protein FliT [Paraburkholderia sp.]|uniref:flagellar protein FliT n=1 Tax=Paraburkholderia sp. TaxID=1926495 RepID=UPI00238FA635|nr:flagellar protein FliT [Paraburkholderia sp.]MDE1181209.1 flagellar protein FliT [Paraburkholderia sp.]